MISQDKNIWVAILIIFFGILVSALIILVDTNDTLKTNYSDDELYPAAFSDSATAVVEYTLRADEQESQLTRANQDIVTLDTWLYNNELAGSVLRLNNLSSRCHLCQPE